MSTSFLTLVQRLHAETGASGAAPTAVTNQTNLNAQLVNWVSAAWGLIQSERKWRFLRKINTFSTIANQPDYSFSSISLADFSEIDGDHLILTTAGGKKRVRCLPYEEYLNAFDTAANQTTAPEYFTLTPDDKVRFYPTPDTVYSVDLYYWRSAVVLSAATDTIAVGDQDAWTIVWRALMLYAEHNDIATLRQMAKLKYERALIPMMRRYLAQASIGGEALA